jgi:hypothetical protein
MTLDLPLAVTVASLIAGSICFLLYVAEAIVSLVAKRNVLSADETQQAARAAVAAPHAVSIDEASRLVDALGRLTDSLSRAGPSLTSLIGAILFFAIAAISSGALHGASAA